MSDEIIIQQSPRFNKCYKKLHAQHQQIVDDAIQEILKNPLLGEEKKADLSQIFVYKFKIHRQEMLLAYEWDAKSRRLILLGSHENFYRELKRVR